MNDEQPREEQLRGYLKRVTAGLHEARQELADLHRQRREPVAIVGMGCRFPGGARNPEDLWRLVVTGAEAVGPFPADRGWQVAPDLPQVGGFLADAADFDAEFFGIAPREALAMDPQHRLALETAWEALENAGIDPRSLRGTCTGVFLGLMYHDYGSRLAAVPDELTGYVVNGSAGSMACGRLAYLLGLEGPAVTVDTACSSSLVALHLAVRALRGGECSAALVGGVTVMATPQLFADFHRQGGLSSDGRCRSFADDAAGTGFSEGAGMLVVERLSDALRLGHQVLALVRGTAINSDGASNGLTAPNGRSQQRVIRAALDDAGLRPGDVDVVEAHGTGTSLGDPIEAEALLATYGQGRPAGRPLWLRSVKSTLGHTQAAAGVAGVITMVAAIQHGLLPSTRHVGRPSSRVEWSRGAVQLLAEHRPWPDGDRPRRAGVSAFGASGTNAHAVLEQPPDDSPADGAAAGAPLAVVPCLLSARSAPALRAQAAKLLAYLGERPEVALPDLAYSLATGRAHLEERAGVLAGDRAGLGSALSAIADGGTPRGLLRGTATRPASTAVLFPGQGAQRPGRGKVLYQTFPVFAQALDAVCETLDGELDRPVRDVLFAEPGTPDAALLDQTSYTQAGLFAIGVALYRLVESWGIRPAVLVGHSVGEICAAHAAGVLSLADACALVAARGRLMQALSPGGAMVAVGATEAQVAGLVDDTALSLAAVNSPAAVVLSGDEDAVLSAAAVLRSRGHRTTRLRVSHAFHSARMAPMLDEFRSVVQRLTFHRSAMPVVSTVTGRSATPFELAVPEYWVRQARATVRFADAIAGADQTGVRGYLELGPDSVLAAMTRECLAGSEQVAVHSAMRRGRPEAETILAAAAGLHVSGVEVDWPAVYAGRARRVPLPTYAFQRRRYWADTGPEVSDPAGAGQGGTLLCPHWTPVAVAARPGALVLVGPGWPGLADGLESAGTGRVPDLAAVPADGQAPDVVLVPLAATDPIDAAVDVLEMVKRWLARPGLERTQFVVLTQGAVGVGTDDEPVDPAHAPVWGLLRTAQSEYPGQFRLADLDSDERSYKALSAVLATDEPQVAIRHGQPYALRLRLVTRGAMEGRPPAPAPSAVDTAEPGGAVLITGGTGAVGGLLARHLVRRHGVRRLVLASRRGRDAPGAARLAAELHALGCAVTVTACDVADKSAVAELLAGVPGQLSMVVHAAGELHDATLATATPAQLSEALRAKVEGVRHLHELTGDRQPPRFVLCSSLAGLLGTPGQAGYAAANAYLDALAYRRRRSGLPAVSLACGPWSGGMGRDLPAPARRRLAEAGISPMSADGLLALFDAALAAGEPVVAPARIDLTALRHADPDALPALWRDLVPRPTRPATVPPPEAGLADRLAALAAAEQLALVRDIVRAEVAAVLGLPDPAALPAERGLLDLGLDSLTAVELRNRLAVLTGLRLPATLLFDHPTIAAVAGHLRDELAGEHDPYTAALDTLETLDTMLGRLACDAGRAGGQPAEMIVRRLSALARSWTGRAVVDDLAAASDDELFAALDGEPDSRDGGGS